MIKHLDLIPGQREGINGFRQRIKTNGFAFHEKVLWRVEHWSRKRRRLEMSSGDMEKPRADTIRACSVYQKLKENLKSADMTIKFLFLRKPDMTTNSKSLSLMEVSRNEDIRLFRFETDESKIPIHHTFLGQVKHRFLEPIHSYLRSEWMAGVGTLQFWS